MTQVPTSTTVPQVLPQPFPVTWDGTTDHCSPAPHPQEVLPSLVSPLCAWCLAEQGQAAGEGSHGICKTHANRLLLQLRARQKPAPAHYPSHSYAKEGGLS